MDNGHTRERVGGGVGGASATVPVAVLFVDGLVLVLVLVLVRRMRVMPTKVRLVGLGARTDEEGYVGCDAPLVQGGHPIVLDKWDDGKDEVSGWWIKEMNGRISLVVGNGKVIIRE